MLDTVLWARDKWLVPGGIILPDKANLVLCAIEDADCAPPHLPSAAPAVHTPSVAEAEACGTGAADRNDKINFWQDVYGFDMSCIKALALQEPLVDTVSADQICTSSSQIKAIDIKTMAKEDSHIDAECARLAPASGPPSAEL